MGKAYKCVSAEIVKRGKRQRRGEEILKYTDAVFTASRHNADCTVQTSKF